MKGIIMFTLNKNQTTLNDKINNRNVYEGKKLMKRIALTAIATVTVCGAIFYIDQKSDDEEN